MAKKIVDITEKLNFDENPVLKVKDVTIEVNSDAATVLKIKWDYVLHNHRKK